MKRLKIWIIGLMFGLGLLAIVVHFAAGELAPKAQKFFGLTDADDARIVGVLAAAFAVIAVAQIFFLVALVVENFRRHHE